MKNYRILQIHNFYQIPGGEDVVVRNEKRLLEEHGHKVYTYYRSNSELNEKGIAGKLLLPFTAVFSLKTYREVKRLIRENNIDIVHVHNTLTMVSPSVFYAAFRCRFRSYRHCTIFVCSVRRVPFSGIMSSARSAWHMECTARSVTNATATASCSLLSVRRSYRFTGLWGHTGKSILSV